MDATTSASRTTSSKVRRRLTSASTALTLAAGVQLLAGTVTSKVTASMLGASGVGVHAIVQATANIVAMLSLGAGDGVVREGGRRRATEPGADISALELGAKFTVVVTMTMACLVAIVGAAPLSRVVLGVDHERTFLYAVAAGAVYAWVTVQVSCFVARRAVGRVSLALVLGTLSTPIVAAVGYHRWGIDGIGPVALMSMLASLITTELLAGWNRPTAAGRSTLRRALSEIPGLVRYGVPHVTCALLTASMLLIVPMVVRSELGTDDTGYYRAAVTVAAGMATLFTFVLKGDFAARVAEAGIDSSRFAAVVAGQLRGAVLWGALVVSTLSIASPIVIRILYAEDFGPAADILPLMLLGQMLGILALAVNLAIGARHGSGRMLVNAAIGGAATIGAVTVVADDGLTRVATAFAAGQAGFLLACVVMLVRTDGFAPLRVWSAGGLHPASAGEPLGSDTSGR